MELRLEMSKVQAEFDHLHYHSCPSYMSKFKMKSIRTVAEERIKKRKEVLNKTYTRGLTSYEKLSVNILSEFIKELSHDLYKNFENAKYTVGQNDEVIGELKQKRNYREQHIFLNKVFFTFSFSDALAVLLHEWAHIYGSDGSRTFSDALTYFIALILKNESIIQNLKQWEQKWTQSIQLIESESDRNSSKESLQSVKNSLTPTQMKLIIEKIPDEDFFLLYNQS